MTPAAEPVPPVGITIAQAVRTIGRRGEEGGDEMVIKMVLTKEMEEERRGT